MTDLKITEAGTAQFPMVRHAAEVGWTPLTPQAALALRGGTSGMLFRGELEAALGRFNPWMTHDTSRSVMERLEALPPTIEGNRDVLAWLRGERQVYDEAEQRHRPVRLIDFDAPHHNVLHVTWEWTAKPPARKGNRADVMFVVNGVPVAIVEHKNPTDRDAIERGTAQLRRYEQQTPELVAAAQLFNVTHLLDYWYGVTWNASRRFMARWKERPDDSYRFAVQSFFEPTDFLRTLRDWILFYVEDGETRKSVLRQHQRRAVERIVARCSQPAKRRGLIWHTQGSGKTFTLLIAARLILEQKEAFRSPTVLVVVDRTELEGQLKDWVERLLGDMQNQDIPVWRANSRTDLQTLLKTDRRGLILSMIHKFEGIEADANTRDTIYVFIDEAHRSVAKDLGTYLMAAVPNATIIGFTGTPIARTQYGEGTFKIFGVDDDLGYLDKYTIAESIEDETTIPICHTLAPSDMTVPAERLDNEFFALAEMEGVTDVDELNRVLDRAVGLRTFLTADDRIDKVAAFVADHFRQNVAPLGYKAFLVGVNREACAKYKRALDRHLPPDWTVPIYTENAADTVDRPLVAELQVAPEREADVRRAFKKADAAPHLLIVTDKLLTGYDAPLLYCLYLDKPMRDHVLLQAIARVNRPYVDASGARKRVGLVVDFVGVLRELRKALRFDSSDVSGAIEDLDVLMQDFHHKIAAAEADYLQDTGGEPRRAPGTDRLRTLPGAGGAAGVLRDVQGNRGAVGNSVAVAGTARPHRDLQTARSTLRRRAQCLRGRWFLRRRPGSQDPRPGGGKRHPGRARLSNEGGDVRPAYPASAAKRAGTGRSQGVQSGARAAAGDRQRTRPPAGAPAAQGARRAHPQGLGGPHRVRVGGDGAAGRPRQRKGIGGGRGAGQRAVAARLRGPLGAQGRHRLACRRHRHPEPGAARGGASRPLPQRRGQCRRAASTAGGPLCPASGA